MQLGQRRGLECAHHAEVCVCVGVGVTAARCIRQHAAQCSRYSSAWTPLAKNACCVLCPLIHRLNHTSCASFPPDPWPYASVWPSAPAPGADTSTQSARTPARSSGTMQSTLSLRKGRALVDGPPARRAGEFTPARFAATHSTTPCPACRLPRLPNGISSGEGGWCCTRVAGLLVGLWRLCARRELLRRPPCRSLWPDGSRSLGCPHAAAPHTPAAEVHSAAAGSSAGLQRPAAAEAARAACATRRAGASGTRGSSRARAGSSSSSLQRALVSLRPLAGCPWWPGRPCWLCAHCAYALPTSVGTSRSIPALVLGCCRGVTIEYQRQQAKAMQKYFRELKFTDTVEKAK